MGHKDTLYALILAGGAGERFWPVSRLKNPKYAMKLLGPKSMIQYTVERLKGLVPLRNILIVTNKEQLNLLRKNLRFFKAGNFLIEPYPRNTAAAIGLGAVSIKGKDPNAVMVVLPADHSIGDTKKFRSTIKKAAIAARNNYLVTLGIKPSFPHTGYGYIKAKRGKVEKFIEKPDKKKAERFLKGKEYFWNSGMFIWKVDSILKSIRTHMPKLYRLLSKIENGASKKEIARLYRALKKISIDYGIVEKTKNRAMVEARFGWSDIGSWQSLEEIYAKDKDGNICKAHAINYDARGSIIVGPKDHLIATCGIKNLVIVHTKDATLVLEKGRAQEIKKLTGLIGKKGARKYL
jgi:mannose-1-phosphate guanylyltransferase